jgi:cytochrome b6-f complex iron-sulfur subunit
MSSGAIIGIALGVLVIGALVLLITTAARRDLRRGAGALSRETLQRDSTDKVDVLSGRAYERASVSAGVSSAPDAPSVPSTELVRAPLDAPVLWTPPDREAVGVTRRHFFNLSAIGLMGVALAGFGAACIAFLWPKLGAGFGGKVNAGKKEEVDASIVNGKGFFYLAEARTWVTKFPNASLPKAESQGVYKSNVLNGMKEGYVALYQKCPHLGCRVPECTSSQWFECPCHGSQYNRIGEKKGGPAPRGMDRFAVTIVNGAVIVDTGQVIPGPAIGTNTTGQEAEGPHCVGGGEGKH